MFVNDQHSTVTLYSDKVQEAIQSSSSLPFITNFNLFCKHKNINRLQSLFQGRNPILLLSILSGVRLIEVFNNTN